MPSKEYYAASRSNEFDSILAMWIDHRKIWGEKRKSEVYGIKPFM